METREQIFDPLRKKRVALTPEERVRQFFITWLNRERKYPLALMASEYTIKYNSARYRCDIVCFNRELQPLVIVECKSPDIKLGNHVAEQISRYNMVLRVKYLIITNGSETYFCRYDDMAGRYEFTDDIPFYDQLNLPTEKV